MNQTNQQAVTLYGMGSPNVVKAVIMLEEIGHPYELRHVAVFKGEQFTPEFLAMNPLGKVPVLVDPDLDGPLAESGAILIWLAEKAGALLPTAAGPRANVLQWLMIQVASIGPMFGQLNHFRILPEGTEPYSLARYREQSKRLYQLLDDRLRSNKWLAGEDYSIADIATYPWAEYLERHAFDPKSYPALIGWRQRIAERAAVVRAKQRIAASFTEIANATRAAATKADLDRFFARTAEMPEADYSSVVPRQ